MNDLLADVRSGAVTIDVVHEPLPPGPPGGGRRRSAGGSATGKNPAYQGMEGDIELGEVGGAANGVQGKAVQQFFRQVEVIKADIAEIRRWQDALKDEHERSKALIKSKEVQQSRQTMQVRAGRVTGRPRPCAASSFAAPPPALHPQLNTAAPSFHDGRRTSSTG